MWRGELDKSEKTKLTGSADQSGKAKAQSSIIHKNLKFTISFIIKK
jgi:hypothetical protein